MQGKYKATQRQRTPKACDRCHRQKLKAGLHSGKLIRCCDTTRPCILCTRAGRKCETTAKRLARRQPRVQQRVALDGPSPKPVQTSPSAPRSVSSSSDAVSAGRQRLRSNTSTIDFARSVFDEEKAGRILTGARLVGDTGAGNPNDQMWRLQMIELPPVPVMQVLIDAYFHRMQWFVLLFVEPQFRNTAQRIISQNEWRLEDIGSCMAVLTVAALGLQSAIPDPDWPGHALMRTHDINPSAMLQGFIAETKMHLLDVMGDCQIEAVQIPTLLSCYYVYHSSPQLAWTLLGMAERAANALDIQIPSSGDPLRDETKSRCWNHLLVGDTFASMVFGRAVSSDCGPVHPLVVLDDLTIHPWLLNRCYGAHNDKNIGRNVFHVMKSEVYSIVRDALRQLRQLYRPRVGPEAADLDLDAVARLTQESDVRLKQWHRRIPHILNFFEFWNRDGWDLISKDLQTASEFIKVQAETIFLQAATLQLTYDAALIQVHRSLLEQKIPNTYKPVMEATHYSLAEATAAALRISHIPLARFQHHFAVSFASMQQFTAGVILCIQPTFAPFAPAALDAKAGVIRIIRACRGLSCQNRIAKHSEQLLTDLLKVTNEREMSRALLHDDELNGSKETSFSKRTIPSCRQLEMANEVSRTDLLTSVSTTPPQSFPETSPWGCASAPELRETTGASDFPSAYIFEQLDNTFGAFGEFFFNLPPDDQNSMWNWGRTSP
ncbi:hypothetical protein N7451_005961 [Penicillium sp. IBT 35674x]|nr:hypothetical protein N7451_005961 [Penicillium sp. IBT 35674x]